MNALVTTHAHCRKRPPTVKTLEWMRGMSWLEVMEKIVNWSDPGVVQKYQEVVTSSDVLVRCNMAEVTSYAVRS